MISYILKTVTQLHWRRKFSKPNYNVQTLWNYISFMQNLHFVSPLSFHAFYPQAFVVFFTHRSREDNGHVVGIDSYLRQSGDLGL